MTEETAFTIDREIDDVLAQEVIRWRVSLPKTERTGRAEFQVFSLHSVCVDDRELLGRGAQLMEGFVQSDGLASVSFAPVEWVEFAEWRHFMAILGVQEAAERIVEDIRTGGAASIPGKA